MDIEIPVQVFIIFVHLDCTLLMLVVKQNSIYYTTITKLLEMLYLTIAKKIFWENI